MWARIQTTRKDGKFGARMAQSAEKAADVGFRNQKWTPERALFNDTNERFQLGRMAEKIDLGDNRQNFDKVKPREIVVKFDEVKPREIVVKFD